MMRKRKKLVIFIAAAVFFGFLLYMNNVFGAGLPDATREGEVATSSTKEQKKKTFLFFQNPEFTFLVPIFSKELDF